MKRRKLTAREVAVMLRVRDLLDRINRPEAYREPQEPELTVEEYKAMDKTVSIMEIPEATRRIRAKVGGYYFIQYPWFGKK